MKLVSDNYGIGAIWMELRDPKKLKRLMIVQDVSQRELAKIAGWKSHSYLGRLMAGKVKTLSTDPALRIAHELGVGVEDLFLTKVSDIPGQDDRKPKTHKAEQLRHRGRTAA